jgi:hypothetical protein
VEAVVLVMAVMVRDVSTEKKDKRFWELLIAYRLGLIDSLIGVDT